MDYSYEDLYGVSIDEYCSLHNTTVDELIHKTLIDKEILEARLRELIETDPNSHLVTVVYNLISKKDKHVERLKKWRKEQDY